MSARPIARLVRLRAAAAACTFAACAAACAPKTPYVAPTASAPAAFKENAGWRLPQPADASPRGDWWDVFGDPVLNDLERQAGAANENLKEAAAQFDEARALVRINRAGQWPQVGAGPGVARIDQSANRLPPAYRSAYGDFTVPAEVTYEADVWGRVRGAVSASRAAAQASAADLETVNLSIHAELAEDYYELRTRDAERQLLDSAVAAFERALELTQNRFRGGIASQADVAQAETQLETTRAQAVDVDVQRAALEHAIAVLTGRNPADVTIAPAPLPAAPPSIPAGLPSQLLERRPDVASAERRVAAANAQIGVARAAFYPALGLTGAGGFESASLATWVAGASNFWSAGASAIATVFDAGRRRAATAEAQAAYQQSVAAYEESVLTAFRDVEDSLAALRVLDEEARIQARAVAAAERSLTLATNRYRGGVATYLEVIAAQSAALTNERAAVTILGRRLGASVLLVKALGGGWQASSLPQRVAAAASPH